MIRQINYSFVSRTPLALLILLAVLSLSQLSCREKFAPPEVKDPQRILVVEGVIVAGSDSTIIRLSRSTPVDSARFNPETGATVSVEGSDNSVRTLSMTSPGLYTSPGLGITQGIEYRLHILTGNGREYLSDYVPVKITPPIDSIGWRQQNDGVQIYVNSSDPTNNTRYYYWRFEETWEIRSFYDSRLRYDQVLNKVFPRDLPADQILHCWKYGFSTNLLFNTTEQLENDVLHEAPIKFIDNGQDRLSVRYSLLLHQYAIDKAAYEFYQLMKQNTEDLGTIFDPQPTEITGNIHSVSDAKEQVIGFITASTVSTKRFFVRNSELDNYRFNQSCESVLVKNDPDSMREAFTYVAYNLQPYDVVTPGTRDSSYWRSAVSPCVDCRERGGNTTKPSYW